MRQLLASLHGVGSSHASPPVAEQIVAIFAPTDRRLLAAVQGGLIISECSLTGQCAHKSAWIACWRDGLIGVGSLDVGGASITGDIQVAMEEVPPVRIGVDIGGTFTDLQIYDGRSGTIVSYKTPTTPEDPSIGLMTGIKEAADLHGFTLPDVGFLLHGTTIATNAILERKLAKAALVTTAGFEDVLEIGRHVRREVYALNPQQPPTLIPRDCRIGITERIRPDG